MPPRRNPENQGLPARWVFDHGAYYFIVPKDQRARWDGKAWFPLGKSLAEAYRTWAGRVEVAKSAKTIGELLDRYLIDVVPKKAAKTQTENKRHIAALRPTFGEMFLEDIEPQHIYRYIDNRTAKTAAMREVEVLSHAYTKAVEWGYIKAHPFKGEIRIEKDAPDEDKKHLIEAWEVAEIMALPARRRKGSVRMIQAYIQLKLLTGLRQRDLLLMQMSQIKEDGIHVTVSKTRRSTGKRIIYEWTDSLRAAVDRAVAVRPAISPFLFCNKFGEGFVEEDGTAGDWNNMWQKFAARLIKETKITAKITDHAFRWKVGSDAENIERAQQLLGHADKRTTEKFYRLKAERVRPVE